MAFVCAQIASAVFHPLQVKMENFAKHIYMFTQNVTSQIVPRLLCITSCSLGQL